MVPKLLSGIKIPRVYVLTAMKSRQTERETYRERWREKTVSELLRGNELTSDSHFIVEDMPPSDIHRAKQGDSHDELLGEVENGDAEHEHHVHRLILRDQRFESERGKR
jgi:hypothetical protein